MRDAGEASDEALMTAYRDGDASAFERLYGRHRGGLYRYLLRQCGKAAVAEELFQDVWLNLIRARSRYVPDARFATYLYRIAHNRLIDHFRRASHRPLTEFEADDADAVAELPADARSQPEVRAESRAALECFMAALGALPDAQREAFVMHEEAGLSVEEIARATGVNTETAKSRLRYALAKLRRGLEEWM
jgi:RNA polymerase sigma-70 factor (ECF subfamily)